MDANQLEPQRSFQPEEILWRHLHNLPYFRAMLRAVEDQLYQGLDLPAPVLDVGSGDGHFASLAFDHPLDVGLDPWWHPLLESKRDHAETYRGLIRADGAQIPYASGHFGSAVSTSVLEHIPHIQAVLDEIGRVVRPGGLFVFCVPNQRFTDHLLMVQFFHKLGWSAAEKWYGRFFNQIARHLNLDGVETWTERLQRSGFQVMKHFDYFSEESLHRLEAGHVFSFPAWVSKRLFGNWVLVQNKANLWFTFQITRPAVLHPRTEEGVCTFYIARRLGADRLK